MTPLDSISSFYSKEGKQTEQELGFWLTKAKPAMQEPRSTSRGFSGSWHKALMKHSPKDCSQKATVESCATTDSDVLCTGRTVRNGDWFYPRSLKGNLVF